MIFERLMLSVNISARPQASSSDLRLVGLPSHFILNSGTEAFVRDVILKLSSITEYSRYLIEDM